MCKKPRYRSYIHIASGADGRTQVIDFAKRICTITYNTSKLSDNILHLPAANALTQQFITNHMQGSLFISSNHH